MDKNQIIQQKKVKFNNNILYLFAGSIITITIFTLGLVIYWIIFPIIPFEIKEPLKILNPNHEVENGGTVLLEADFCKNTDADGEVEISLIGLTETVLTTTTEGLGKGCIKFPNDKDPKSSPVKIQLPILVNLEPRKVHYKVIYRLNPLRTFIKEFESEEFTIKNSNPTIKEIVSPK